jgi:hypothetical protein
MSSGRLACQAALAPLRLLVAQGQASVSTRPYTPEGERPRENVRETTAGNGRRVEPGPWARGLLAPSAAAVEDPQRPIGVA